jgi:NAD-dependent SIR2 family protein deacetylase
VAGGRIDIPPGGHPDPMSDVERLRDLVHAGSVTILCGAGLSTESGIPDYRGPTGALRARLPMTIAEFTGSAQARRRYWARSHRGWRRMSAAAPNAGHEAIAALQAAGLVHGIITQNVDGLQQQAGARDVIELHGSLADVVCLRCGARSDRARLDARLRTANPDLTADAASEAVSDRPDGDVELPETEVESFALVQCEVCGSDMLKPDVVFFGENVPRDRVDRCHALVESAASLLVVGSSLTVMSGLRFVHRAERERIPVAIVNRGQTRGDPMATVKLDASLGEALRALVA